MNTQVTWYDLTNPQRQTLCAIDLDTRLELRHSYYMPHAKRLLELELIAVDGDGYIVTEAGKALAATPQPSAVDIEAALRQQLAAAQAERDRLVRVSELAEKQAHQQRAALDETVTPKDVPNRGGDVANGADREDSR
jgi:hypothetical protein